MLNHQSLLDAANAVLQLGGAWATWRNVEELLVHRILRGVRLRSIAFFAMWGVWNVFYFWELEQWLSVATGLLLCTGNAAWVALALHYRKVYDKKQWL